MHADKNRWEKRSFSRSISELNRIFDYLDELLEDLELDDRSLFEIKVSVEELFSNVIKYNRDADSPVEIGFNLDGERLRIQLSSHENKPFDITKTEEVDFDDYIEQGRVGGLGIQIVKKMMDHVDFNHHQGLSTITLTKYLSGKPDANN